MTSIPINTYDGIKNYCLEITSRSDDQNLIDNIDNFIYLAQISLCRRLNIQGTQKIVEGTILSGNPVLVLPNYYIRTISFTIYDPENRNEPLNLLPRTTEYVQNYDDSFNSTGIPVNYTPQYSIGTFLLSPTPKELTGYTGYPYKLIYHEMYNPLSSSVQQNYFTERLTDALIYSTMIQIYNFLRTPALVSDFTDKLNIEIQFINNEDQIGKTDRTQNSKIN